MSVVQLLLAKGASVYPNTLSLAGQQENEELVKCLLLKTNQEQHNRILRTAVVRGKIKIAQFLLESKVSPNEPTTGTSHLNVASRLGYTDIVKCLLEHKAALDTVDEEHQTALHLAASNLHYDIVKLLLTARADPAKKNSQGKTPLQLAEESKHLERGQNVIRIFEAASKDVQKEEKEKAKREEKDKEEKEPPSIQNQEQLQKNEHAQIKSEDKSKPFADNGLAADDQDDEKESQQKLEDNVPTGCGWTAAKHLGYLGLFGAGGTGITLGVMTLAYKGHWNKTSEAFTQALDIGSISMPVYTLLLAGFGLAAFAIIAHTVTAQAPFTNHAKMDVTGQPLYQK